MNLVKNIKQMPKNKKFYINQCKPTTDQTISTKLIIWVWGLLDKQFFYTSDDSNLLLQEWGKNH